MAIATVNGRSCLIGGFDNFREQVCYDTANNAWTVLAPMPVGRDHAAAVVLGEDIFVAGGNRSETTAGQEINGWRYRKASGRWEPVPELPDVVAAGGAMLNGYAFFGQLNAGIFQVDLRTLARRFIPGDDRVMRDHAQLVAFQGEIWFIGGRGARAADHNRVSIYDPASETWRVGPGLDAARAGFAAASSPTMLLVAGGEKIATPPYSVVKSVEALAAGDEAWTNLGEMPIPVHGVGGAIHGNAFFVLGGSGLPGGVGNEGAVQIYRWAP